MGGSGLAGGALRWAFWYCVVMFLMPFIVGVLLYLSASIVFLYGLRRQLRLAYLHSFWDGARHTVAAFWLATGKFMHGYEVEGLEKLPLVGPALIVYYHGTMPLDIYYLVSEFLLRRKRLIRCVADRFVFRCLPGLEMAFRIMGATEGSVDECVQLLDDGNILSISPGGVREALFGTSLYKVLWGHRTGFARVALQARVPVFPMFTYNCREAVRPILIGKRFWQWVYEKCRLPIIPCYGFFPVKMKTFIGDPIAFDPLMTPEQLALKVRTAIESMIQKHQRLPGGILMGMMDRLPLHWLGIERKGLECASSPDPDVDHPDDTSTPPIDDVPLRTAPLRESDLSKNPSAASASAAARDHFPTITTRKERPQFSPLHLHSSDSSDWSTALPRVGSQPVFGLATTTRRHPHDAFWSRCTCAFAGEEHAPDCAIHIPVLRSRSTRSRDHRSQVGEKTDGARRQRDHQKRAAPAGGEVEHWPSLPMRFWLRVAVASVWNALSASDYFYAALVHDHAVLFEGLELPDDGDSDLFD